MMPLTGTDFARAAAALRCSVAAIKAVDTVESAGAGFLPDGRPKILFEAHQFGAFTGQRFTTSHPRISSRKWNRTLYARTGAGEHDRLAEAAELDRMAALKSASWGRFQIMGFNYRLCGFDSVQAFVNAMYQGEGAQLDAFVAYVKARHLDDELQRRDWPGFAHGYNGPRYAENRYDTKLASAYRRHGGT
ncbi:N-acetylmuramidase family protein [Lysobacter fragariae]